MVRNLCLAWLLLVIGQAFSQSTVHLIRVDGVINPASAEYVGKAIAQAEEDSANCLIIELDTPGGLVTSMREITKNILGSRIPVIVYVSPAGARAGSAGVFITLSGHIAAMAPGTNIGAASVVSLGMSRADSANSTMMRKATNDAVAFIKSLAEERGRNVEWAEKAVTEAASITAREALEMNVIDVIAPSLDSLLSALHGREVAIGEKKVVLDTRDASVTEVEMPLRFKILDVISDPSIAYILFILGLYGLMFEIYNPGSVVPGIIGGICIILFFYSMNTLPVNYAGVLLILLSVILFVLEIKIPSYGALTIGGIIAFVLGSIMLYDSSIPFMKISWEVILAITITTILFFGVAIGLGLRAQRRKPAIGREQLLEEEGEVLDKFRHGKGQILFQGEIWKAMSAEPLQKGDKVVVERVDGLLLHVRKSSH